MNELTKWSIDPAHSEISFKVKHLMLSHIKGVFKIFDASIYTTGKDFTTADINLSIDAGSISTGDIKRDKHLKSADFFDVQNHAQIIFISSTLGIADAQGNQQLWGELTMKGITQDIKLDVRFGGMLKDPWGVEKAGFTVTGKINRNDWGLKWNTPLESGGFLLSEEVTILCEVELINEGQKILTIELESSVGGSVSI